MSEEAQLSKLRRHARPKWHRRVSRAEWGQLRFSVGRGGLSYGSLNLPLVQQQERGAVDRMAPKLARSLADRADLGDHKTVHHPALWDENATGERPA